MRWDQPARMWRLRLRALYCVRTKTRRREELMQLERVTSMMRYRAPKGTAGLARSLVSGQRRSPCPPARRTPSASRISGMSVGSRGRTLKQLSVTAEARGTHDEKGVRNKSEER